MKSDSRITKIQNVICVDGNGQGIMVLTVTLVKTIRIKTRKHVVMVLKIEKIRESQFSQTGMQ